MFCSCREYFFSAVSTLDFPGLVHAARVESAASSCVSLLVVTCYLFAYDDGSGFNFLSIIRVDGVAGLGTIESLRPSPRRPVACVLRVHTFPVASVFTLVLFCAWFGQGQGYCSASWSQDKSARRRNSGMFGMESRARRCGYS